MKRTVISIIALVLVSVGGFFGVRTLVEREEAARPKGFDPSTIPDVVQYTAGIPKDTVVATVDGQGITAESYLYWVSYVGEMAQYYQFNGGEIDWNADMGGVPLSEYVKSEALNSAELYRIVETKAGELGCGFNEANQAAYSAVYQQMVAQYGGEEELEKWLLNVNLTPAGFETLNRVRYLYENIQNTQTDASPADSREMEQYIQDNDMLQAKHILLMTIDAATRQPLSDADKEEKRLQAEELLLQLRESDKPLELFDELMNQYSEDTGLASYPDGYSFTAGEMVAPFEEGTRALAYQEISEVIESDFGYHIILRLDPASDALAAQIGEERAAKKMDELLQSWMEQAKVETTQAYDQLDAGSFYTNLLSLREEIAAADAAAQEPTPVLGNN